MKFRSIVICYIFIMLLGLGILIFLRPDTSFDRGDMTYYYNTAKSVSEGNEAPEDTDIIYMTDEDYSQKYLSYIKNNALIMDILNDGQVIGKIVWTDVNDPGVVAAFKMYRFVIYSYASIAILGTVVLLFIYSKYIRPFGKLQKFTGQIAKGNLDFPLAYGKDDFFGAFTESFDIMREELKKARSREAEAKRAKHEMMAELSHDIRTPLSTINATCEVLEAKSKDQDVLSKAQIIKNKAGTIDSLITNMMNASLEDISELKVEPSEQSSLLINSMIDNVRDLGEINVLNEIPGCILFFDPLRLEQVIDNIIGNSIKYAGTPIDISFSKVESGITLRIADKGPGVDPDEVSLLTQKFYRGKKSSGTPGSGLGLYLAKYYMEHMDGDIVFTNDNGFVAEIFLRKVS